MVLGLVQGLDVLSVRFGHLLLLCNIFFFCCFFGLHLSRLWKLAWSGLLNVVLLLDDLLYLHLLNQRLCHLSWHLWLLVSSCEELLLLHCLLILKLLHADLLGIDRNQGT